MPLLTKQPENLQLNYSAENNRIDKSIQSYISKLEKNIIIQSKKISDLEKYNYKCEQFIKKINPYQILPITDEMLSDDYEIIKDPINAAEQQNYADLLKKTIENELIKKGLLNHNVNAEEVIDLAKMKLESKEYKKQLVLAHSMINSLKSDLIELTKENEEFKMSKDKMININNNESINMNNNQIFDINQKLIKYKENFEKINKDFEKLMEEKKQIKKENNKLKKEIELYKEQTIKLNEDFKNNIIKNNEINNVLIEKEKNELILENENLNETINQLELQLKSQIPKSTSELRKKFKTIGPNSLNMINANVSSFDKPDKKSLKTNHSEIYENKNNSFVSDLVNNNSKKELNKSAFIGLKKYEKFDKIDKSVFKKEKSEK